MPGGGLLAPLRLLVLVHVPGALALPTSSSMAPAGGALAPAGLPALAAGGEAQQAAAALVQQHVDSVVGTDVWGTRDGIAFDDFCATSNDGCWPSSFLLGNAKSGTSAVAMALYQSGQVQLGRPDPITNASMPVRGWGSTGRVKEPHAFDAYLLGSSTSPDQYTRLFRRSGATAPAPSFLDATPSYFSSPEAPSALARAMPAHLLARARFVVILREPVARSLNWFNHMRASVSAAVDPEHVRSDCFRKVQRNFGTEDGNVTFDAVTRCAIASRDLYVKWGSYIDGIESWTRRISRKQLLVLSHDTLLNEPERAMGMVTTHYGVGATRPSGVQHMGADYVSNDVVEVVRCDTLAALRYHFIEPNEQLYARLNSDRHRGHAPDVEEPFPEFHVQVPCADYEITTRQRTSWERGSVPMPMDASTLAETSTTSTTLTAEGESDDSKLQRLGVFDHMAPHRPIIFGVITGGGMEQRYGSIAKTWCGPHLAACVYFSNVSTRATEASPANTVDIVQEAIAEHGYPAWSLRSEHYWPIYRSAQLRFLPALHWLRERVLADPAQNPRTAQYFGDAKWILLVDDDTFVFYHNLATHLASLDHTSQIYTGLVSPSFWIPTNLTYNGHGEENRDGYVNSYDLFVNGGSGSIFSRGALLALDTQECVNEMKPDGRWWQYQSDWAIGSCARRRNIFPRPADRGLFNQFICVDGSNRPFYCETYEDREKRSGSEGMIAWDRTTPARSLSDSLDGPLVAPCTIHPIKKVEGYLYLWQHYSSSWYEKTKNVTTKLRDSLNIAPMRLRDVRITTVDSHSPMVSMRATPLTSI